MTQEFIEAGKAGEPAPGTMKRIDVRGRRILLANVGGQDAPAAHVDALHRAGRQLACFSRLDEFLRH